MKNLKRALSFAVAAVMLVGMMAIGTSAFTDDADIVNTEAVNIMNQLGIIAGKPDGSFDPEATVARGEMAKMICVALNGGKDPVLDTDATSYPDTVGHWAAGYIEYCTNLGIVAGSTDGNFYPNAPITGTEAAKMVLIALGYDAAAEGFVNNKDWSTNINVVANKKDLYDELAILPGAPISRDNAAQMLYNGMTARMVEYDYKLNTVNGELTTVAVAQDKDLGNTILEKKFDMGWFTAILTDATYSSTTEKYTYTFASASDTVTGDMDKSATDFTGLYMQKVKVLYKQSTDKMFGMYAYDSAVLAECAFGDIDETDIADKVIDVDGTEIDTTGTSLAYYEFLNGTVVPSSATNAYAAKVIDNTGDDKADLVVVYPYNVAKVDYVGKTTVSATDYTGAPVSLSFEDDVIYAGIAEDDYIQITAAANTTGTKDTVTKVAATVGTVDTAKASAGTVKIGGEWYTDLSSTSWALNTEYDLVVLNGYVYYADKVEETLTAEDVLYVMGAKEGASEFGGAFTQEVKVMFNDGTTAIVTVDKLSESAGVDATDLADNTNEIAANGGENGLYTYAVDKDGNYELSVINPDDYEAVDNGSSIAIKDGKTAALNGGSVYRFNADAVIWVVYDSATEVAVVSGADVNKWDDTVDAIALYGEMKNGFAYAQVGVITNSAADMPGVATSAKYGLVTAATTLTKVDTKYVANVTVWNGTEEVVLTVELADSSLSAAQSTIAGAAYLKGQLVTYDVIEGNEVENLAVVGTVDAVKAYDGTNIEFAYNVAGEYEITEDTVFFYIDSAKVAGVEGGKISIASKAQDGSLIKNVYVIVDDANQEVDVMFIDVNNELDAAVKGE